MLKRFSFYILAVYKVHFIFEEKLANLVAKEQCCFLANLFLCYLKLYFLNLSCFQEYLFRAEWVHAGTSSLKYLFVQLVGGFF